MFRQGIFQGFPSEDKRITWYEISASELKDDYLFACLEKFYTFLSSADLFKICSSKNSFRYNIRESNSLDPDQARHFVGPELGPN